MIEFYNQDCLEALRATPNKFFDLAIVDPPYQAKDAIGVKDSAGHLAKRKDYHLFENIAPSEEYFKELYRVSNDQIIWGANWFGIRGDILFGIKNKLVSGVRSWRIVRR